FQIYFETDLGASLCLIWFYTKIGEKIGWAEFGALFGAVLWLICFSGYGKQVLHKKWSKIHNLLHTRIVEYTPVIRPYLYPRRVIYILFCMILHLVDGYIFLTPYKLQPVSALISFISTFSLFA
ncbi:hypothetical protein ACJX0J_009904, partial [Zea mays]